MPFIRGKQGNRAAYERTKITRRTVEALKPGERLWDDELAGFVVRCQARSKTYGLQVRINGAQRWITVGKHPVLLPEQARQEARRLLGDVAAGKDPASERDRRKSIPNIAEFGAEFLASHVEAKLKPSTQAEYRRILDKRITPAIGKLRIDAVTEPDVAKLHGSLRTMPYEANRVLAVLSKMMTIAERQGVRPKGTNPCQGHERYRESKRERFLSAEELGRLGEALATAEASSKVSPYVIAALRLLIFTGARRGEVLNLRWEHVDVERGMLHLPDSKTGKKTIHMHPPAVQLLASLRRVDGNPYVFAGGRADHGDKGRAEGQPIKDLMVPWIAIRNAAGLAGVRMHDLRHSYASVAAARGGSLLMIGKLLGHSHAATTARYAHLAADPMRDLNDKIGETLAGALNRNQRRNAAEVIPLPVKLA